eukprot:gene8506-4865_t
MPCPATLEQVKEAKKQTSNGGYRKVGFQWSQWPSVAGDRSIIEFSARNAPQNIPSPGFSNLPDQPQLSDPGKDPFTQLCLNIPPRAPAQGQDKRVAKTDPQQRSRLSPMEDHHSLHGPKVQH